jgi:hypothetical protein
MRATLVLLFQDKKSIKFQKKKNGGKYNQKKIRASQKICKKNSPFVYLSF